MDRSCAGTRGTSNLGCSSCGSLFPLFWHPQTPVASTGWSTPAQTVTIDPPGQPVTPATSKFPPWAPGPVQSLFLHGPQGTLVLTGLGSLGFPPILLTLARTVRELLTSTHLELFWAPGSRCPRCHPSNDLTDPHPPDTFSLLHPPSCSSARPACLKLSTQDPSVIAVRGGGSPYTGRVEEIILVIFLPIVLLGVYKLNQRRTFNH